MFFLKRDKKRILSCFTDEYNNVGPLLQKGCDLVIIRNKYIHTDHQMNQSTINNINRNSPESFVSDSENDNVPDSLEGHDANHDSLPDVLPTGTDFDEDG